MIDDRSKMLYTTIHKLYRRGAKLNIQKILVKNHEADIAEVLPRFDIEDGLKIFKMEPSLEKRANILSHLEERSQVQFLQQLSRPELVRLINRMDSDDVADLLGKMTPEESNAVLADMEQEDSVEVADLLGYPEDSAGGLMSYDYFSMEENATVAQTIQYIQDEDANTVMFYIYVINGNEQLLGVLSLKQLLLSKTGELLKNIMFPDVISVTVDTDKQDVAKVVERYDYLSIPVVDSNNTLVGVITVDDVIDVIREEAQEDLLSMGRAGYDIDASVFEHIKARLPWVVFAYIGGVLSFLMIYFLAPLGLSVQPNEPILLLSAFIPLILTMGATSGSQSVTIAVGAIKANKVGKGSYHIKELWIGITFFLIFTLLTNLLAHVFLPNFEHLTITSVALGLQMMLAIVLGSLLPKFVNKIGVDPLVGSVPLFTAVADLTAMAVLFGCFFVGA